MGRAAIIALFLFVGASACSASSTRDSPDGGADQGGPDGGDGQDGGVYHQGVYTCCGEHQRLSCCTADGLLGYQVDSDGTITPVGDPSLGTANCFQYGGTSGACIAQGDSLDHKDICSLCCAGLVAVPAVQLDGSGNCAPWAGASVGSCVPCGNGTCDTGEDRCNCPADCGAAKGGVP